MECVIGCHITCSFHTEPSPTSEIIDIHKMQALIYTFGKDIKRKIRTYKILIKKKFPPVFYGFCI